MKLTIPREEYHRRIYLFGLALLVCSLPLSRFLLSISQLLLAVNWIASGRFREKTALILRRPSILIFAAVFVLYALGLIYTQHMETGIARVKNALPLLMLPLVMGTSLPLDEKHVKRLLLLFSAAVMVASLVCLVNYLIHGAPADGDFRKISVFMLHIRFSLMIVMAIAVLLYYTFYNLSDSFRYERVFLFVMACLLIAFLFFLRSFTGIAIFIAITALFLLHASFRSRRRFVRYAFALMVTGLFLTLLLFTVRTWVINFQDKPVSLSGLETKTAGGNPYTHNIHTGVLENGEYIDLYVCEPELKKEWNKISTISYDSVDRRGQPVSLTIRRYLTSKGLRKDSAALARLNKTDVWSIENGLANYRFRENSGLYQRLYELLWEIQLLSKTGYVQQHSLGQRLAFLVPALTVMEKNFWAGVGTGDVYDAMLRAAQTERLAFDPLWEGKPHNQFLFHFLAFGLAGFLCLWGCMVYPVLIRKTSRLFLFNIFAVILLMSMFTLDTLESYDSMVFFAFFYCLFVFATDYCESRKA
jgi:hypothetical protein